MVINRRIASLGVLSLLATIMTVLALTVNNPSADKDLERSGTETGVFSESRDVLDDMTAVVSGTDEHGEEAEHYKVYLLKDTSGYIGIYSMDDPDTPQTVTEIVTSKLRQADAEMLKEGIVAVGEEELAKLLEDFGS
ncbi:MAG: hypothetical protein GX193_04990 [Clostridiales bacterium]|nr:hypothetical protein [Clostridiales bacterium]